MKAILKYFEIITIVLFVTNVSADITLYQNESFAPNDITENINTNTYTITITDKGIINNTIYGYGAIFIDGDITTLMDYLDTQRIAINAGKTLNISGVLDKYILGNGIIKINDSLTANYDYFADNTVDNQGLLILTGGTIDSVIGGNGYIQFDYDVSMNIDDFEQYIQTDNRGIVIGDSNTLTLIGDVYSGSYYRNISNVHFFGINNSELILNGGGCFVFENAYSLGTNLSVIVESNSSLQINNGTLQVLVGGNGTLVIGGNLYSNADYLNTDSIYNFEQLTLTGGTLAKTITSHGTIRINGHVSTNADYLDIRDTNGPNAVNVESGTLTLTDGTIINKVFTGYGTTEFAYDLSINADTLQSYVQTNIAVAENHTLALSGGTINKNISGNGSLVIAGNVSTKPAYLETNTISVNNGSTLSLTGDSNILEKTISGNGTLVIDGYIYSNADYLNTETVTVNAGKTLRLTGGTIDRIISGEGTTQLGYDLSISAEMLQNYLQTDIWVEYGKTLSLTGGTLNKIINGPNAITENTSPAVIIDGTVSSNADYLNSLVTVNNEKILTLTNGTVGQCINGDGALVIAGNVSTKGHYLKTNSITVDDNATLTLLTDFGTTGSLYRPINGNGTIVIDGDTQTNADYLNTSIVLVNSGKFLDLTEGTINTNIKGEGTINISGNVFSSADKFNGDSHIVNNGSLTLTDGTLQQPIFGRGKIIIDGSVVSSASNFLTNVLIADNNFLTLTDGTLQKIIDSTNNGYVVINGNVLTQTTNLLTDVQINDSGTLTLLGTNDIFAKNINGNGDLIVDGDIVFDKDIALNTDITINDNKSAILSIDSLIGNVKNNGELHIKDGGMLASIISGDGKIFVGATVDNIVTNANNLQNPLAIESNLTKLTLVDGIINKDITGGTIHIDGDINSNVNLSQNIFINKFKKLNIGADNISGEITNHGVLSIGAGTLNRQIMGDGLIDIVGDVLNNAYQYNDLSISDKLTTNADMLHMSKITNNGVLDITSGILTQDVVGGKTIIADGAGISSKNIGDLELNGNMYVGNNTITAANTTINGTVNMDIEKISANSNEYIGGYLIADNVSLGDNSKLNLTIYNTDLLKGESTGDISLISTNGDWSGSFGSIFQNNNRYSIAFDDTTKTFKITHVKIGADVIAEAGGTNDDIAVASAWDELPSSTLPNVQYIIDEINHRSQHDTDGYLQLIKSLQPVKTNVVHGVSRSLNNAINTQITERLTAVTPMGRNGGDTQAKTGVWAQGMYNKSNQSGDYSFNGNTIGVIAGFDTTFGANITMGAGYAFSTTDVEADMRNLEVDGHNLFIYGKYQGSNWHVNANLSYGMSDYTDNATALDLNNSRYARRIIPTQNSKNGGTSLSDSEYSTNTIGASALFGYGISENIDINIGTRFNHITVDDYTDMAGQSVSVEDMDFMTVLGGFSYGKQGQNWTPVIHIATTYDVLSDDYIANVDLGGSGYVINGENIDPFGIEAGISLETNGDIWDFSIGYDIEWHSNFISHTGKAKLKYNF